MYRNTDEIEKLKRIKEDSNWEAVTAMKQLKDLSESRDLMQQELVELRQVRDAAQEVAEIMEILEGNKDEPLTLAGKLHNHSTVRGACTRVGKILLAKHTS
jgi:hypothetical protein